MLRRRDKRHGHCIVAFWWLISFSLGDASTMATNSTSDQWSVTISQNGRSGSITYRESTGSISFYCEFGGSDSIAIIWIEKPLVWNSRYPWAVKRRREILERVAHEVVRQKASTCRAEIDEQNGYIYLRERAG